MLGEDERYNIVCEMIKKNDVNGLKGVLSEGIGAHWNEHMLTLIDVAIILKYDGIVEELKRHMGLDYRNTLCANTPLHTAIIVNNMKVVMDILLDMSSETLKRYVNIKNSFGNTALHLAVLKKQDLLVDLLVIAGANVNDSNIFGITPMHYACSLGDVTMVHTLLKYGASYDNQDKLKITPRNIVNNFEKNDVIKEMFDAKDRGKEELIEELYKKYLADRGKVNNLDDNKEYSLNEEVLQDIIYINISYLTKVISPFNFALAMNNEKLVKMLMRRGESLRDDSKYRLKVSNCLPMLVERNKNSMLKLLIRNGANMDVKKKVINSILDGNLRVNLPGQNFSLLMLAINCGNEEAIKFLVESGANVNEKTESGMTPLSLASHMSNKYVVEYLLKHGAEDNKECESKEGLVTYSGKNIDLSQSALHWAVYRGYRDIAFLLIVHGVDVERKNLVGETPLQIAVRLKDSEATKLLVEFSADCKKYGNDFKKDLLNLAVRSEDEQLLDLLMNLDLKVEYGKDDKDGDMMELPLVVALEKKNPNIIKMLLQSDNSTHKYARRILRWVWENREIEKFEVLIKCGCDINGHYKNGDTFLHDAIRNREVDSIRMMLRNGAELDALNVKQEACADLLDQTLQKQLLERIQADIIIAKNTEKANDLINELKIIINTARGISTLSDLSRECRRCMYSLENEVSKAKKKPMLSDENSERQKRKDNREKIENVSKGAKKRRKISRNK